jgi:hypothetical protein
MTDPLNMAEAQVAADRQLAAQHPNDVSHQRRFAVSMHRLVAQYRQAGQPERSAGLGDEAIGIIARISGAAPSDADWADAAGNVTYIGAYLVPGEEAIRTIAAAVDIYRAICRSDHLQWALDNLNARYAAAPQLVIMRAAIASADVQAVRAAIREHRLSFEAARIDEAGVAHADIYTNRDVLDALLTAMGTDMIIRTLYVIAGTEPDFAAGKAAAARLAARAEPAELDVFLDEGWVADIEPSPDRRGDQTTTHHLPTDQARQLVAHTLNELLDSAARTLSSREVDHYHLGNGHAPA